MNPQTVVKPLDLSRLPSADEFNRMPDSERQRWIEALRHSLPSTPTITKAAKPKVTAHVLKQMQQLQDRGYDMQTMITGLKATGLTSEQIIDAVEWLAAEYLP